jgi:hypothetical protein
VTGRKHARVGVRSRLFRFCLALLVTPVASLVIAPGAGACPFSPMAIIFPAALPTGGVLYDQYDHACAVGTSSQNFEASLDANDDESADDFVVPPGQRWNVDGVDVDGIYFNGPGTASSVNVRFYANREGNLPGAIEAERLAQPFTGTGGDFVITLSPTVNLAEGIHWVSVQANQNLTPAGRWHWIDRTVISNAGAAWRNPGNGFGTGCTAFARRTACIPTARDPDQVYRLRGRTGKPPPSPLPIWRCVVPKVIGRTLSQARQRIRARHCSVGRISRVRSRRSIRGRVMRVNPRPGAVRRRGFPVSLVIGRGRR